VQLIPAIDLRDGRCVRLYQGDFDAETHYGASPEALYERYADLGVTWLHVVDLDGARAGVPVQLATIASLARRGRLKLQVGGGLRDADSLKRAFEAGAARVVIGSRAVTHPELAAEWLARLGPERLVLALDVRHDAAGEARLAIHGWRDASHRTLWDALARYAHTGLAHVLCTDIERDGALTGPSLELYAEALRRYPHIAWQASGGVHDAGDLAALAASGLAAAVSGRALLEQRITPAELEPFLRGA
jgi:phosphoribosylformimino-5-aminoimidazole carboxamide ribotide isomerase